MTFFAGKPSEGFCLDWGAWFKPCFMAAGLRHRRKRCSESTFPGECFGRAQLTLQRRAFRIKNLHDIARILRARPVSNAKFWTEAGHEFKLACQSRSVDCHGLESFMENRSQARERYETDARLRDVPFDEAEHALKIVVGLIEKQGIFPLEFPTT